MCKKINFAKKTLLKLIFSIIIFLSFSFFSFNFVYAENNVSQTELESSIEKSIDIVLKKYLENNNLNIEIENQVKKSIMDFFNNLDKKEIKNKIKDNIKAAITGSSAKLNDEEEIKNAITDNDGNNDVLKSNLNKIQEFFEKTIIAKTYEYSKSLFDKKVKEQILAKMRDGINSYNNSCYYKDEESGTLHLKPGAKLISNDDANKMIKNVSNNIEKYTSINEDLSNNILNNTTEFIYLANLVTDYLFTDESTIEAVESNGGSIENIDRLEEYINIENILNDINEKLNTTISNDIKTIIQNSIKGYLENASGESIFKDIKSGIYYYISENGGFDKVIEEGLSTNVTNYITDQVTLIIKNNIEYQVAPYVSSLIEERMDKILLEISINCLNNGVDKLLRESVTYGVSERFEKSLSEIMSNNLVTYANKYLKNLENNNSLKNIINVQFSKYSNVDWGKKILYNVGTKFIYSYDEDGNIVNKKEVESECVTYAKTVLLDNIKIGVKESMAEYMNSEFGDKVVELAKLNMYDVLKNDILNKVVINVNKTIVDWIEKGLIHDIWDSISKDINLYIQKIGYDSNKFEQETGILFGDILMEVRYDGEMPYNRRISLEDLSDYINLISAQRGAIITPRHSNMKPLEDATVEVGYTSIYEQLVETSATQQISDPNRFTADLINPIAANPYGLTIYTYYGSFGVPGPAGISRTIPEYSAIGVRELTASEAYILAHQKNTGYYPDAVQMAYWNLEGKTDEVDEGIVDMDTYNKILTIVKIGSIISGMLTNFMNLYGNIMNLMQVNFSNILSLNFDIWNNIDLSKISEFFKNISFVEILNKFSITGFFENMSIAKFIDVVCNMDTINEAGKIIDYILKNGLPTDPYSIVGAIFISPINPYFEHIKGSDWVKIYKNVGNAFENADNLIAAINEVYDIVVSYFAPTQREIVDNKLPEDTSLGMELYGEAKALEDALYRWNDFREKNGATLIDRTDYEKVKVSYSKNTDEILVGPFTIDYVREFYSPLYKNNSLLVDNETNLISFAGIIEAQLYADDEKTIPITDWEFVYPDKEREIMSPYDRKYQYPYPNETFYLKFPSKENYSINTLSRMTFVMEKMDADGQVNQLKGSYDQLLWVGVDIPIVCPLPPIRCIHGSIGGHVIPPSGYCPPVSCILHHTPSGTPPFHFAFNGHLFGHYYFCQQVPLGKNLHAMNLEQIIYSKIYREYETIELELGEEQTYFVESINNTSNMMNSINKGNIVEQANKVPILPYLPNYDTYPGYPNYPDYEGNPNYPDNPYSFNNEEYKDYASYPQYNKGPYGASDPVYPYYPSNKFIPLTFHISGTVWLDNPSGKEIDANGIFDENERGIPNVEVILYKKGDSDYIAKTLTNEEGYYIFEYVRVGFDYYVEFAYDGMTYKTTEYLQSDYKEHNGENLLNYTNKYISNPENYLTSSHAIENVKERDNFNDKFYKISENLATAKDGSTIPLEYKTWQTPNGAVSTIITVDNREITKDEFKMYARTKETDLYFPLNKQYQVDFADLDLYGDGSDKYIKTYPGLEHINLGLIQREQGDLNTKTDVYQVITTLNNDIQKYKYNNKNVNSDTYDILFREGKYYTEIPYHQELDPNDYSYRYDADSIYGENTDIVSTISSEKDELNVYIEYKMLLKNNGTIEKAIINELENSFDKNLLYDSKYDWTDLTSWIEVPMDGSHNFNKEEILWEYRNQTENGYFTIYTDDLKDKILKPGEVLEIHLILRVKKDNATDRNLMIDLEENQFKECITEVTNYSYTEGVLDKTSNPGSARLGNARTYADGTDIAPLLKVIFDREYSVLNSNTIQGYVWEDLVDNMYDNNNQLISNGLMDKDEEKINNVKVELVQVLMDKNTGEEIEVLRKTASGTDYYITGQDIEVDGQIIDIKDGEYKFLKLETGTYRVKFTYGDEYQLSKDLTFNAQDYKSVSLDTTYQQYYKPKLEVMLLLDTSPSMKVDNKGNLMRNAIPSLVEELYKNIQTIKIGGYTFSEPAGGSQMVVDLTEKPNIKNLLNIYNNEVINSGKTLSDTIYDALNKFSKDANGKVIFIMTDGYMQQSEKDKEALLKAEEQGVKVITIACSTDEWDSSTFGTEDNPTTGILYNIRHLNCAYYVSEVALEDILLEFEKTLPNLTDAKDVEEGYSYYVNSKLYNDIYSRRHNIDYFSTITNSNGEVLDLKNIIDIQKQLNEESNKDKKDEKRIQELKNEINEKIRKLSENSKVTAITPNRNITFLPNKEKTEYVNLGLVERPKVELKIEEKISGIQIKLANGEIIVDTTRQGLSQNVQYIKNDKYIAYMDKEIMQGATINIEYKITITNNGLVDTLADYFTYDMFNEEEVRKATETVANKIGTLNNYYSNSILREVDNTSLEIEVNDVQLRKLKFDGITIKNWDELIDKGNTITPTILKINTRLQDDKRVVVLREKVNWKNNGSIGLNESVNEFIDNDEIKIAETKSLRNVSIYPNISKEALSKEGVSSINVYVNYSKQLSGNDDKDSLLYKNSTEIVERLNNVGRRDYMAVVGNYFPHSEEMIEYDSIVAEEVVIMHPFGQDKNYIKLVILFLGISFILGLGIIFIKKKVI